MSYIAFYVAEKAKDVSSMHVIAEFNSKRFKKSIGISVKVSKLTKDRYGNTCVSTKDYPHGAAVNFKIAEWRSSIGRVIESLGDTVVDSGVFWQMVKCDIDQVEYVPSRSTMYLSQYMAEIFIPRFYASKTESRIKRFRVVLHLIQGFEQGTGSTYRFDDIDITFYRNLREYMSTMHYSANYFASIIKILKQVMREAQIIDKLHDSTMFMHSEFKVVTMPADDIYLTIDELTKIHQTQIDDVFISKMYPRLSAIMAEGVKKSYTIVKNKFLIGAFTGLRLSDFQRLAPENFGSGMITIFTQKTNQKVVIPIHPVVQDILDSGFDVTLNLSEQKTRRYIKDICRYVMIDTPTEVRRNVEGKQTVVSFPKYDLVSTHTARRSFATNAHKAGIPSIAIMKITGHTKEETFLRYIKVYEEENAQILSGHDFFTRK